MRRWLALMGLAAVVLATSGCANRSEDDISARPWNSPRYWETGLPSGMYEGR